MQLSKQQITQLFASSEPSQHNYFRIGDIVLRYDVQKNRVILRSLKGSMDAVVRLFWNAQANCYENEDFGEPMPNDIQACLAA